VTVHRLELSEVQSRVLAHASRAASWYVVNINIRLNRDSKTLSLAADVTISLMKTCAIRCTVALCWKLERLPRAIVF